MGHTDVYDESDKRIVLLKQLANLARIAHTSLAAGEMEAAQAVSAGKDTVFQQLIRAVEESPVAHAVSPQLQQALTEYMQAEQAFQDLLTDVLNQTSTALSQRLLTLASVDKYAASLKSNSPAQRLFQGSQSRYLDERR